MFRKLFSKNKKKDIKDNKKDEQRAIVFVDYEHWFYSYKNLYNMKPNVEEWYEEISNEYEIEKLMIFGDFSERGIGYELNRLEKITNHVIHTTSSKEGVDKDFTDFIMLDYIYQAAVEKDSPEVVIIFTGDGHFDSVIKYLKNKLHKRVIVYGVKRAFSGKLKSTASSYVDMPRYIQQQQYYYNLILNSLSYIDSKPDKFPTYWKTIRSVAEYNGIAEEKIQMALDNLLEKKYIVEMETMVRTDMKMRVLDVDWKRLEQDGIWEKNIA